MKLSRPATALLTALLLSAPAHAAHAGPAAGQECVEYNGKVVYCIDYN